MRLMSGDDKEKEKVGEEYLITKVFCNVECKKFIIEVRYFSFPFQKKT